MDEEQATLGIFLRFGIGGYLVVGMAILLFVNSDFKGFCFDK
jgi:hypothetical protein